LRVDFVAAGRLSDLVKDIAMQIAAADPQFIRREDVTKDVWKRRPYPARPPLQEGKPRK